MAASKAAKTGGKERTGRPCGHRLRAGFRAEWRLYENLPMFVGTVRRVPAIDPHCRYRLVSAAWCRTRR
ncbi:MAG: hypothetical protein KDE63_04020 [Novosphingobium sp.]|nr:hypothetical protein [Novosphingobium sp.]